MASVIQLPSAPNTGYDALANVLLQSATQFGAQRRADAAEERRRADRLSDIESDRAYADTNYSRSRGDRLADIEGERKFATEREAIRREQLLADRDEARDWESIIKKEGVETAQARLNQLADEEAAVAARMDARQKRLSAPEPMPSPEQVRNRALAIARQSSPDKAVREGRALPSNADISAALPLAEEEARQVLNNAWQRERLDAQEEQRIDSVRLARIGSEKNTITNLFRRVGMPTAQPPVETALTPPSQPKTLVDAQRAFEAMVRPQPAATQAAPRAGSLFNPDNDPIIAAEQVRRDQALQASRLAPIQQLESEIADVESRIAAVQKSSSAAGPSTPGLGMGITGMTIQQTPPNQAEALSGLYQKRANLAQRKQSLLADPMLSGPGLGAPAPQSPGGTVPGSRLQIFD